PSRDHEGADTQLFMTLCLVIYYGHVVDRTDLPMLPEGSIYTVCYGFRPIANWAVLSQTVRYR
ncbi:MAG: hypothetical protein ACRD8O_07045, partial [Bryobacteraceae bacterium]